MELTIAQAVVKIIKREPFYGLFLLGLNKYFDNSVPTACVRRNGINVEIAINEEYWKSLTNELQINCLLHEVLHILYKHLGMCEDFPDKDKFNIAADCHVNSYLGQVHEDWYLPKDFNLETGKGTKFYYEHIPDNVSFNFSHNGDDFKNLSSAEKQLINNQIDYQVKEAAEEAMKTCGYVPGNLKEYIDGLFKQKERIFNGKGYFNRVIGNSIRTYIKSTRYRPSYRFKGEPGNTLKFKPKILVAVDTSGSVSNNELRDFFTEINHLYKSGVYVEVVEFDTCIQNKFVYKGQKTDIKIIGRGVTDMSDVYNYYIANPDFSTLVIFTDGYLDTDYPSRRNLIGVISSNGSNKKYPGIAIHIPKEN